MYHIFHGVVVKYSTTASYTLDLVRTYVRTVCRGRICKQHKYLGRELNKNVAITSVVCVFILTKLFSLILIL
jgi:hypothetical protein